MKYEELKRTTLLAKPKEYKTNRKKRVLLSEDKIKAIFLDTRKRSYIAHDYDVAVGTVRNIQEKLSYENVTEGLNRIDPTEREIEYRMPNKKVLEVYLSNETVGVISRQYEISAMKVIDIKMGRIYSKVTEHLRG